MTLCRWIKPAPSLGEHFTCDRCGERVLRDESIPVLPYRRACRARQPQCAHRGDELQRIVECPTCTGRVRVKVFACDVHGECTQAKRIAQVACCAECRDFTSTSSGEMPYDEVE